MCNDNGKKKTLIKIDLEKNVFKIIQDICTDHVYLNG